MSSSTSSSTAASLSSSPPPPPPPPRRSFFVFEAGPRPAYDFSFPAPTIPAGGENTTPCNQLKRRRSLADVDGEWSNGARKKTRLRRFLITSRLSQPFSAPPTHIVDRGSSKIAVWAKQRTLGRSWLRKAAIMNHVRRRALEVLPAKKRPTELVRPEPITQCCDPLVVSKQHHISSSPPQPAPAPQPTPSPSPLGISNYDALDEEDDREHDSLDTSNSGSTLYSDFSVLESTTDPETDEHDVVDMARPPPMPPPKYRPPSPDEEEDVEVSPEIRIEGEWPNDISFISFEDV
ncbi:MAG: hypothetical protein M1823_000942 [Watsoniomyces obsoletus]|nr:MAG: hypothetical protein M1823_000942 [Watsoniomyces obsoletus]